MQQSKFPTFEETWFGLQKKPAKKKKKAKKTIKRKKKVLSNKLNYYSNEVFKGRKNINKKKQTNFFNFGRMKIKREITSKSQEKTVKKEQTYKCAVCGRKLDSSDLVCHHINGDRSKTVTKNLIAVCRNCHSDIHTKAKAMFVEWKRKERKKKESYGFGRY